MSNCHWQLPSLKSIVHTQSIHSRVPEVTYISRGPENLQDELDKIWDLNGRVGQQKQVLQNLQQYRECGIDDKIHRHPLFFILESDIQMALSVSFLINTLTITTLLILQMSLRCLWYEIQWVLSKFPLHHATVIVLESRDGRQHNCQRNSTFWTAKPIYCWKFKSSKVHRLYTQISNIPKPFQIVKQSLNGNTSKSFSSSHSVSWDAKYWFFACTSKGWYLLIFAGEDAQRMECTKNTLLILCF